MNGDGYEEAVITMTIYPENIPHSIIVLDGEGPINNIAKRLFPSGVPSIRHSNQFFS
jgi:hypothetical protein